MTGFSGRGLRDADDKTLVSASQDCASGREGHLPFPLSVFVKYRCLDEPRVAMEAGAADLIFLLAQWRGGGYTSEAALRG
jgi:hypothetical protein